MNFDDENSLTYRPNIFAIVLTYIFLKIKKLKEKLGEILNE
jgi:hypothetical protein